MSLIKLLSIAVTVTLASGSVGCVAQTIDPEPEKLGAASEAAFPASGQATYFTNVDLPAGTKYTAPDGRTFLAMQADGNLVLYFAPFGADVWAQPLWASNTAGHSGAHAAMQSDGNLVVYAPSTECFTVWGTRVCGGPLWSSNTSGSEVKAAVQNDGNFVIYDGNGNALWASNTEGSVPPSSMCLKQPSNNAYFCPAGSWWQSCDAPTQPNAASSDITVNCAGPKVNTGICTPDPTDPFKWTCKYETEWVLNTFSGCPGETQTAWNDNGSLQYTASEWCP